MARGARELAGPAAGAAREQRPHDAPRADGGSAARPAQHRERRAERAQGGAQPAWEEGKVSSREAWQRVKPFKQTTAPPPRWLSDDEVTRLLNAAEPAHKLVHFILETWEQRKPSTG